MPATGLDSFDNTLQKTNIILFEIEQELGWSGRRDQTYDVLRAVLHTLRDRLPVDEAVQFGAQLPMLMRGFYYEGWDPSRVPVKMDQEAFIKRIREEFPFTLSADTSLEDVIHIVMKTLEKHMDKGELEQVRGQLPDDLVKLLSL